MMRDITSLRSSLVLAELVMKKRIASYMSSCLKHGSEVEACSGPNTNKKEEGEDRTKVSQTFILEDYLIKIIINFVSSLNCFATLSLLRSLVLIMDMIFEAKVLNFCKIQLN